MPNNIASTGRSSGGDVDAAFKAADVVVKQRIINQRLIPNAMEPRAALAQYNSAHRRAHALGHVAEPAHRTASCCSLVTGIPEHKIRVIAPEVGGGFGSKIPHYPERLDGDLRVEEAAAAR